MIDEKISWAKTQLTSKTGQKTKAGNVLLGIISELKSKISELEAELESKKTKPAAKKPAAKKPATKRKTATKK